MSGSVVLRARQRWLGVLVGGALLIATASCGSKPEDPKQGQPPQDGGVEASWTGSVSKLYPSSLDMGVAASKTAAQKLNLRVSGENAGFMKRTLDVGSDEMSVVIEVAEVTKESTRISVKVGWFGDADASRRIHSEIEAEIGNLKKQRKFPLGFSGAVAPAPGAPPP
jgi:hypothetical protein